MRIVALFVFFAAGIAFAGEYALLASGARMRVDRHEHDGSRIRLYSNGGYAEIGADQVVGFESEDPAPPAPLVSAAVQPAPPPSDPATLADAAADRYGLPRALVRSVISAESAFRPDAVSPKGAIGLMQLMPATARGLGADPSDPAQNIDAGTRYLRDLLVKYDGRLWHALAAYNAGPGAVERYNGVPRYQETLEYINRVMRKLIREP